MPKVVTDPDYLDIAFRVGEFYHLPEAEVADFARYLTFVNSPDLEKTAWKVAELVYAQSS